ncbi:MAG: tRNA uridine-5-carboxymethylaminomethyl(34) synthesis GTPase MnmE [Chitinophagales bacterium]
MNLHDTIVALATPQGMGAIGVIRLSGNDAIAIAAKVFHGKDLNQATSHTVHYGTIKDGEKVLDEVLVTVFRAPKSFTTEDVIEIAGHGSPFVLREILGLLIRNGARAADAGEFTMRAFMHGRINLAQAEAVADMIASESEAQMRVALQQMRGGFSAQLQQLREKLIHFASLVELELDFSEEDVTFADRNALQHLIADMQRQLKLLQQSFRQGNVIRNGVNTVIAGRPNAGKSTLLNALLQDNRAIVSDIPGTTRDVIEETLIIGGISFRLMDTAGIREATDAIEKIGVERTMMKIGESAVVLFIFDVAAMSLEAVQGDLEMLKREGSILIPVGNKTDLIGVTEARKKFHSLENLQLVAARSEESVEELKQHLLESIQMNAVDLNAPMVTNVRHFEALRTASEALEAVLQGLEGGTTGDFLAADIRTALRALGSITGEIDHDRDILGSIFGKFCIGK